MSSNKKLNDVSVVIATLALNSLKGTIDSLNIGSIIPKEILICIPEEYSHNLESYDDSNVKILYTKVKGQVAQRIIGFHNVKSPYVLQLDDDIILDFNCLENLLKIVRSKSNLAVGPKLFDLFTNQYHSFLKPVRNKLIIFNKLFYYIANGSKGYQPGKISKSGINFGIPEFPSTFNNVDWLCGGCLMHRKENLILSDYYPFLGKAYAEDLFHSNLLRINKVILVRCGEAKCYVDFSSSKGNGFLNIIKTFLKSIIPMKAFVKSINGSIVHLYLIYMFFYARLILLKIIK